VKVKLSTRAIVEELVKRAENDPMIHCFDCAMPLSLCYQCPYWYDRPSIRKLAERLERS
jgi:hypothetical protein